MINILLSGCNGRMGQVITKMCTQSDKFKITAGIDKYTEKLGGYDVYPSPEKFEGTADVVIDFSNVSAFPQIAAMCENKKIPLVLCTTGLTEQNIQHVQKLSEKIPVLRSGNMSVGINLMLELVKKVCNAAGNMFDVEIIEKHHNKKLDAPSGTALMIADAAAESLPHKAEFVYDRHSTLKPRDKKEIGISAVRGGTIVGEHEIIFAGEDEVIEIKHTALSRNVFAVGALNAAEFLSGIGKNGLYTMADVVNSK